MRYFSFHEYDNYGGHVSTMSESEILKEYWPYWYKKMCEECEQSYVDEHYSFEDCLEDWKIVHWAWEVKDKK